MSPDIRFLRGTTGYTPDPYLQGGLRQRLEDELDGLEALEHPDVPAPVEPLPGGQQRGGQTARRLRVLRLLYPFQCIY